MTCQVSAECIVEKKRSEGMIIWHQDIKIIFNGYNKGPNIKNDIVAHREVKCYLIKGKTK